jgi:hypothetical protein
MLDLL